MGSTALLCNPHINGPFGQEVRRITLRIKISPEMEIGIQGLKYNSILLAILPNLRNKEIQSSKQCKAQMLDGTGLTVFALPHQPHYITP